jgi:hypothetical protein
MNATKPNPSLKSLLNEYARTLDTLLDRKYVRTRNGPIGDAAEYIVSKAYEGKLEPNSKKSYDVTTGSGKTIQVKARAVNTTKNYGGQTFSAIRSFDCDLMVFLVFDQESLDLVSAHELSSQQVREIGSHINHVNARVVNPNAVKKVGQDVTELIRAAYEKC